MLIVLFGLIVMLATDTLAWALIGLFIMIHGIRKVTEDE